MTTPLRDAFLTGMSKAAASVNIVTTDGPAGRSGATVSAMSSVSADGEFPTLLICMNDSSVTGRTIRKNGSFCVNLLRDNQAHISDSFAGRGLAEGGDKFACATWEAGESGSPRLQDGLVCFECRLSAEHRVGSHHIFIGEVIATTSAEEGLSLIYTQRRYASPVALKAKETAA